MVAAALQAYGRKVTLLEQFEQGSHVSFVRAFNYDILRIMFTFCELEPDDPETENRCF